MTAVIKQVAAVAAAVLVGLATVVAVKAASVALGREDDLADTADSATVSFGTTRPDGPDADVPSIEDLIAQLRVVDELPYVSGYEREKFGTAWDSGRGTLGCGPRSNLLADQLVDPTLNAATGCVVGGQLHDPYTGQSIPYEPGTGTVEVDHVVPLLVAWRSGAADWPQERRVEFAGDTEWNLLATSREANQEKQAAMLSAWMPPNEAFRCEYAHNYLMVATKYALPVTAGDVAAARTACTVE